MESKYTEKFDGCRLFLKSIIYRHLKEIDEIQKKINVYKTLDRLLEKKSKNLAISDSEYAELRKLDCPHISLLELFAGNVDISPEGLTVLGNEEDMLADCYTLSCDQCWKQYINELVESINSSELIIKMPPEEDL